MVNTEDVLCITMSVQYLKHFNSLQNNTVIFSVGKVVTWEMPKAEPLVVPRGK